MGCGIWYQLKSCVRDKMCILSFLLPVIAGIALNFLGDVDLLDLAEPEFGVVKENLTSPEIRDWLEGLGTVKEYLSEEELREAVLEPSTSVLGIRQQGGGISVTRAGDEPEMIQKLADRLPLLYEERDRNSTVSVSMAVPEGDTGLKNLFISIIMVTAMFMGGTFSAMNILGEKEDGTILVNDVLPRSRLVYLFQKIAVGLLGGILSAGLTALVCLRPLRMIQLPGLTAVILL